MNYDDLPEWYLPYFDHFTGPNWSDGKFQSSTSRSKKRPLTKLDWHSRDHDSEYALCDSLSCLDDADKNYYERTRNMSLGPKIIGAMPLIGNAPLRMVYRLIGAGYRGSEHKLRKKMGSSESKQTDEEWKEAHPLYGDYQYHYVNGQLAGIRPMDTAVPQGGSLRGYSGADIAAEDSTPGSQGSCPIIPDQSTIPVRTMVPQNVGNVPSVIDLRDYQAQNQTSSYNPYASSLSSLRTNPFSRGPGSRKRSKKRKPQNKNRNL